MENYKNNSMNWTHSAIFTNDQETLHTKTEPVVENLEMAQQSINLPHYFLRFSVFCNHITNATFDTFSALKRLLGLSAVQGRKRTRICCFGVIKNQCISFVESKTSSQRSDFLPS